MLHLATPLIGNYWLHPLRGLGYQLWSGIAGCLGYLSVFAGVVGLYKHHNCEQKGCLRLGHRHPEHGRPVCRQHYHDDVVPPKPEA